MGPFGWPSSHSQCWPEKHSELGDHSHHWHPCGHPSGPFNHICIQQSESRPSLFKTEETWHKRTNKDDKQKPNQDLHNPDRIQCYRQAAAGHDQLHHS